MKIDNIDNMLQLQMLSQLMNSSTESAGGFDTILESMLEVMGTADNIDNSDSMSIVNGLGMQDLSQFGYGGGQVLDPLVSSVKDDAKIGNVTINQAVDNAAQKYHVDKKLIMAVINQESSFNPNATSKAGAMGLMQLMPGTAEGLGVTNPYDISQNVDGGTKYLRNLLDMYGNCKELALAAYNAGPNALAGKQVDNTGEINRLPAETQDYVKKVMEYYND